MYNQPENIANKIILWGIITTMFLPLLISPYIFIPDKFVKAVIFRIIVEIILIAYIFLIFRKKEYWPRWNAITISIIIFWFVGLLATIFSTQPFMSVWGSATRGSGFFNFTHFVIFFFISTGAVNTSEKWRKILDSAIAAAILLAVFGILQRIFPGLNANFMNSHYLRPASTMGNTIMLANYLAMMVFLIFIFWRLETAKIKRLFYFLAGFLILAMILISQTRGTFMGLIGGGLLFLLFYPSRNSPPTTDPPKAEKFNTGARSLILLIIVIILFLLFIFNSTLPILPQRFFLFDNLNRLASWQIALVAIKDKPLLGWGPENFAIPFDKYYPGGYTNSYEGLAETWWDRAHNVPLDIGATMGPLGLVAYLGIYFTLFWQLYKYNRGANTITLAIGATFIAYFIQNLTSFDSVSSYILFFTLLAYVIFLSKSARENININLPDQYQSASKTITWGIVSIIILFIIIKISIVPFLLNYKTNSAARLAKEGKYNETMEIYRDITSRYRGKTYYEKELNEKFMKIAAHFGPGLLYQIGDREEYIKLNQETIDLLKRSAELERLHTKHYYNIGLFYNNIGTVNPVAVKDAVEYFQKALELSPKREQTLIESTKSYIIMGDYDTAIENLRKVMTINPELNETYLWLGVANLYKGDTGAGKIYLDFAKKSGRDMEDILTLKMLAGVYADIQEWPETIPYYLKILEEKPNDIDTRAMLAGSYGKIGKINEAREQAEILLQIAPQAKKSIEEFLKSL